MTRSSNEFQLAIAATFTAELLEQPLAFWTRQLGVSAQVSFLPFNQILQTLLDGESAFFTATRGLNVVLVRLDDWRSDPSPSSSTLARVVDLESQVRDLVSSVTSASARSPVPILVVTCRSSGTDSSANGNSVAKMEETMAEALAAIPNVRVMASADICRDYSVDVPFDEHADRMGSIPYTAEWFAAVGTAIARTVHSLVASPRKVIVLDADNTLWHGVCGEDGSSGVVLDAPRVALQEFMLRQRELGRLLCLCSKNNEEDLLPVLDELPGMLLRRAHFTAMRINWKSKADNIAEIARELQLGFDGFIFVDDDALEVAEVAKRCPGVLAFELPRNAEAIPEFVRHLWAFDPSVVTEEDRRRAAFYRTEQRRTVLREGLSAKEFFATLNLEIDIFRAAKEDATRLAQLTARTNQFNCTIDRRTERDMEALLDDRHRSCLAVKARDRYGDYGTVGLLVFQSARDSLVLETFLLSCRALGRGIEHQLLCHLGKAALDLALPVVAVMFAETARNRPARDFLDRHFAAYKAPSERGWIYRIPAQACASLRFEPPAGPCAPAGSDVTSPPEEPAKRPFDGTRLGIATTQLTTSRQIADAVAKSLKRPRPALRTEFVPAATPTEKDVCAMWEDVLLLDAVGAHDNFFELGGHSFLAIQIATRVRRSFGVELPLEALLDNPTPAGVASCILEFQTEAVPAETLSQVLRTIEGLSDDEVMRILDSEDID